MTTYDIAIIGGGIVGLATGMTLAETYHASVIVVEAQKRLAMHQTGHNSGVIHSGLYYKPGSLKARNCVQGREAMYQFCAAEGLPHEPCGKLVVATHPSELPRLEALAARGEANGLQGLRRLSAEALHEHEPFVQGLAGLYVPQTGIVSYKQVAYAYAKKLVQAGGTIQVGARLYQTHRLPHEIRLETTQGEIRCHTLINCAGLQADRVARMTGIEPQVQIVPFRGEYYHLRPERRGLVRNLIYPVPDPRFPFLGVHFTRMVHGGVEAGPNAVLAWKREGYRHTHISRRDTLEMLRYGGFWRLAMRHGRMGLNEFYRSLNKAAFVRALQRLIPEVQADDLTPGKAGVRAQALRPDGSLVDDFHIIEADRMIHVLNAPSPAATASLSIGQAIAQVWARQQNKE